MPESKQSAELELSAGEPDCGVCGISACEHSTTTYDPSEMRERRQERKATVELPAELAEFSASYEVKGLVGEGGMSAVYKAQHRALDKPMAIKMLHAHLVRDPVQRQRFKQEAQALFVLKHPNIVNLYDFGATKESGKPFLIMDFLEGRSLAEVLKDGPLPVARALRIFLQVCDALEFAHKKAIIHRDIKPSNIVLTTNEEGNDHVHIVDFGIAKFNQDEINPGLTQTGDVFGSPLYMSPEQCLGHKLDGRSDIYAFGCVMYEVLSGRPPLAGESALSTIHKHTSETPLPLQVPDCEERLRQRLDEILFKTLEKDPDQRYQSITALRIDLLALLEDTGYRKGAGFYVRYARFTRKITNSIKTHPVRFSTGFAAATALVSFATYAIMSYASPLMKPVVPLYNSIFWVWIQLPVEPQPIHFPDSMRKARFFIYRLGGTIGPKNMEVVQREQKFAKYLIGYGAWDEAVEYLAKARQGFEANYGPEDANLPDIDQLIGDCYVQQSDYATAAPYFDKAIKEYRKIHGGTADNSEALCGVKLAICQLKTKRISEALLNFNMAREYDKGGKQLAFTGVVKRTGLAECQLAMLESGAVPSSRRESKLREVRLAYDMVKDLWTEYSAHDSKVALLRVADTRILEGDLEMARKTYEKVLADESLFTEAELADIKWNYARILWRTLHLPEAIAMQDQAIHAAKSAAASINEQTKTRFKAIRRERTSDDDIDGSPEPEGTPTPNSD